VAHHVYSSASTAAVILFCSLLTVVFEFMYPQVLIFTRTENRRLLHSEIIFAGGTSVLSCEISVLPSDCDCCDLCDTFICYVACM
jgi:hypothetical protein